MDQQAYIKELFTKYLNNQVSDEELKHLYNYFDVEDKPHVLQGLIQQHLESESEDFTPEEDRIGTRMKAGAWPIIQEQLKSSKIKAINTPQKAKPFKWWYAAASIFLISLIGTFAYLSYKNQGLSNQIVSQYGDDVKPGTNLAYITLSDGKRIVLDSSQNVIENKDGQLQYENGALIAAESEYATITTPIGGEYKVILPDGTKAWLNASSSIQYPTRFTEKERSIEVEGEVYLEVASDKNKPFKVKSSGQEIEVLGTAFNVRNYYLNTLTTLIHGKIALTNQGTKERITLNPGQQATITNKETKVQQVEPADFVAWKDGFMMIRDADILVVCKELERWYGVKFKFPNGFSNKDRAFLSFDRNVVLSTVLLYLEKTYGVKFSIKGKEVLVN